MVEEDPELEFPVRQKRSRRTWEIQGWRWAGMHGDF